MKIQKLSDLVVSQIAAGEVIETPAGAVKEILENALDAGASKVEILTRGFGLESIQIRDNGTGIEKEDLRAALQSFATSKIKNIDDLYKVRSMGFRGEALSSIRSVSRVTIESRAKEEKNGWQITAQADEFSQIRAVPFDGNGTRIIIENLFFNVPIRKKFLKDERKIRREIQEVITSYALANPNITFLYVQDGKEMFRYNTAESLLERIGQVFGAPFAQKTLPVYEEKGAYRLEGYISGLDFFHSQNSFMRFFINGRKVIYKPLLSLLKRAYGELLPPGKYPAAVLFLNTDLNELDVNVHPQKKEVKFKNARDVEDIVYLAVKSAMETGSHIPSSHFVKTTEKVKTPRRDYVQPGLNLQPPLVVNEDIVETSKEEPVGRPHTVHGTLYDTLILATSPEGIYLIDQHTAHERIRYEEILNKLEKTQPVGQPLSEPAVFHLSPEKKEFLEESEGVLKTLGFDFEDMGPAGFQITTVPSYVNPGQEENAFELSLNLLEKNSSITAADLFDKMAKSMACRFAIKKGDPASKYELTSLIERLYQCKNPSRCPHGRPTIIFMGKQDLFSFFKRTV